MVPYHRPRRGVETFSPRQFVELGDRLNIAPEAMAAGLANPANPANALDPEYELRDSPGGSGPYVKDKQKSDSDSDSAAPPFVSVADPTRRARFSEMPSLPSVMARFRSPLETASPTVARGADRLTRVYVTTQHKYDRE